MGDTRPSRGQEDVDIERTTRQARSEGADTAGLEEALAASADGLAEAQEMAAEADDHIREARRQVDQDLEMNPDRERHLYESGSIGADLDDQAIAPPG
jgi:hypothetical protein